MRISFSRRDLTGAYYLPGVSFEVERMSWDIQGGPASAVVLVRGPANRLGMTAQLLRCGALISDDSGGAAWWGFVNEVEICLEGGQVFSVSLDDLANRVAVRYRDERISPDVALGWQFQSFWAQDNQSVTEWGKKEAIFTKVPASPEETRSLRAAVLEQHKRPSMKAVSSQLSAFSQRGKEAAGWARLRLKGWWSTLNWLYFGEGRGYSGFEGGGAVQLLGNLAANTEAAESFTTTAGLGWTAQTAWIKIGKYGSPADNVILNLSANNSGLPGAVLDTVTLTGATLTGDLSWVRFDFAGYAMNASTTYWVEVKRSGVLDVNNYYRISVDEGLPYAGVGKVYNGAAWVARVPDADMVFQVTGRSQTTDQIKTMADPSGAGQFLKGVFVIDASGVNGRLYRDGRERAGDEIQALLDQGNSARRALMAWVSPDRWLLVKLVPAVPGGANTPPSAGAAQLLLLANGELRDRSGKRLPESFNPIGKWARLLGLDQLGGDRNAPGSVLVNQAVWEKGRLAIQWE